MSFDAFIKYIYLQVSNCRRCFVFSCVGLYRSAPCTCLHLTICSQLTSRVININCYYNGIFTRTDTYNLVFYKFIVIFNQYFLQINFCVINVYFNFDNMFADNLVCYKCNGTSSTSDCNQLTHCSSNDEVLHKYMLPRSRGSVDIVVVLAYSNVYKLQIHVCVYGALFLRIDVGFRKFPHHQSLDISCTEWIRQ